MTTIASSASYSLTVRLEIGNKPGMLGKVTSALGKAGGDIGAVDLVEMTGDRVMRDITIKASDSRHGHEIIDSLKGIAGVRVADISDRTFLVHLGGEIEIKSKVPIRTRDDLSMAYTPGVARVCLAIKEDLQRAFTLTIKHSSRASSTRRWRRRWRARWRGRPRRPGPGVAADARIGSSGSSDPSG